MKLLGWMRHKTKQTSTELFKEFTSGIQPYYFGMFSRAICRAGNYCCLSAQASHEDQDLYPKSYSRSKNNTKHTNLPTQIYGDPSSELKLHGVQEKLEDENSIANGELFPGFLTIGTLGTELLVSEPATPKFAASLENVTGGKEEMMTKDNLKPISEELENFLESEADEVYNESPGRGSQASIITLSGKPIEGTNVEENGETVVCPLQGYLLVSSIELPKTEGEVKKRRGSLAELLRRRKFEEENSVEKCGKMGMQGELKQKHGRDAIKKIMKKILASPKSSNTCTKDDSVPVKKKLRKVVQKFHRKIHPEISTAAREDKGPNKDKVNYILSDGSYINEDVIYGHKNNEAVSSSDGSFSSGSTSGSNSVRPQDEIVCTDSNGKTEKWIKTDTEYLVLEL